MKYTTVLSIAGSDCSGGAGIQADIKTISALGCYAASIVTAVTIQNTCGVKNIYPIPAQIACEKAPEALEYTVGRFIPEEVEAKDFYQYVLTHSDIFTHFNPDSSAPVKPM